MPTKQQQEIANQEMTTRGRWYKPARYKDHKPVLAFPVGNKANEWYVKPDGQEGVAIWTDKNFKDTFIALEEYEN